MAKKFLIRNQFSSSPANPVLQRGSLAKKTMLCPRVLALMVIKASALAVKNYLKAGCQYLFVAKLNLYIDLLCDSHMLQHIVTGVDIS